MPLRSPPVPRMGRSPDANPLHVRRTPEVIAVLRLTQPAALTGGLAGLAAGRLRTIVLMAQITRIGPEQFTAMPTLTSSVALHRWCLPVTPIIGNHADGGRHHAPRKPGAKGRSKKTEEERKRKIKIDRLNGRRRSKRIFSTVSERPSNYSFGTALPPSGLPAGEACGLREPPCCCSQ